MQVILNIIFNDNYIYKQNYIWNSKTISKKNKTTCSSAGTPVKIQCAKLISLNRKKISRGIRLIPFSKNILPSTPKT